MTKLETIIEAGFVKDMARRGIYTIKLNLQGNRGWPDRLVLVPGGRAVFIEFKRPRQFAEPLQEHRLSILRSAGYHAVVMSDRKEACRYIEDTMKAENNV